MGVFDMPTKRHAYNFPTRIEYGPGAVQDLAKTIQANGCKKGLLVSDKGVEGAGLGDAVRSYFKAAGVAMHTFDDVKSNPVDDNVYGGAKAYKESGSEFIVGLGGGSALDVAKAIKCMATHDGPLEKYDDMKDGWKYIQNNMPPFYAVPTTAGTGSEVGRSSVITIKSTNKKTIIFSPYFMPNIAVLDPELTLTLPPHLTAATGIDAFVHNLEALLTDAYHPLADGIAKEGLIRGYKNLLPAVQDGKNVAARGELLMASAMGATAFQKGLGVNHSIAHALGVYYDMHHGLANAIVLIEVMKYNMENATVRDKLAEVAQTLGARKSADAFIELLGSWLKSVGIPENLKAVKISSDKIPALETYALEDPCCPSNPRKVEKGDVAAILQKLI
jgi:4-hydroxybutyrate dehydrogenase